MQQHVSATHHQCNSCISHCCSLRFHKDIWQLVMSCRQAQQKSTLGSDFLGWGLAVSLLNFSSDAHACAVAHSVLGSQLKWSKRDNSMIKELPQTHGVATA